MSRRMVCVIVGGLLLSLSGGCVERTVKIDSRPAGALVVVNDEEVGVTPVKFSFLWYGEYDLILRKTGYQTVKTSFKVDAPWWQLPPVDLVTETLLPQTFRDDRVLPPFELAPLEQPPAAEVVRRASELRERALSAP